MLRKNEYRHIFFDLDHTLWDYQSNSRESLGELFQQYQMARFGTFQLSDFIREFERTNFTLWSLHSQGKLSREELRTRRFPSVYRSLGLKINALPDLEDDYQRLCPAKPATMPFAHEILNYLKSRYHLHIITNGFDDVQEVKLRASGLQAYFQWVFTAESCGVQKPDPRIFEFALEKVQTGVEACLMIGDSADSDIQGAKNVKMDYIYYDPNSIQKKSRFSPSIHCLSQLKDLL